VARKEIGLEVNHDKTKYMVMCRDQNTGRSHNIKNDNSSFHGWKVSKFLGTTLKNQNSIHEEINSRLMPGNACYQSVKNLLSFISLSKNINIKIYRTIIFPVILYKWEN
jgi:hypothetical protein